MIFLIKLLCPYMFHIFHLEVNIPYWQIDQGMDKAHLSMIPKCYIFIHGILKKREQIKDQILIELQICHVKLFIPNYHLEQTDIIKIYFQFAGLGLGDNSRPYNNYNSKYTIILQLS